MITLIFEPNLKGHHLEYLHHLYVGACKNQDCCYVFAVPHQFNDVKNKFLWKPALNIDFFYLRDDKLSYKKDVLIQLYKCIKKIKPKVTILVSIMWFMPYLILFSSMGTKFHGIIYNIYLYDWKNATIMQKVKNYFLYTLYSKFSCFQKLYILNDNGAAHVLNKVWNTNRFHYLPDPFLPINSDKSYDLHQELNIDKNKKVFLHFGAMSMRKGTLDIFSMIENTNPEILGNYCLIFAGKVEDDIREKFYEMYHALKAKIQIIIEDDFVDYERLGSLLLTCDVVLLPYRYVNVSSGAIGYCAQFQKPAIVFNKGLIGKLVRRYHLGMAIDEFKTLDELNCRVKQSGYCEKRSPSAFSEELLRNYF